MPRWDVGGVSGAELIGSTFEVTFADDYKAAGTLSATGKQAGSRGQATEQAGEAFIEIFANDKGPGEVGTYTSGGPQILLKGEKGQRVRVVLAKGFIQPVRAYEEKLENQLRRLSRDPFPANNAVEFQFADITLTGTENKGRVASRPLNTYAPIWKRAKRRMTMFSPILAIFSVSTS